MLQTDLVDGRTEGWIQGLSTHSGPGLGPDAPACIQGVPSAVGKTNKQTENDTSL